MSHTNGEITHFYDYKINTILMQNNLYTTY